MSAKQTQDKIDKRAAALRENLKKRQPVRKKESKDDANNDGKTDR
ncbi:MAG: hypothetical protein ACPGRX_05145 [Bdellovibrionales bacterium]